MQLHTHTRTLRFNGHFPGEPGVLVVASLVLDLVLVLVGLVLVLAIPVLDKSYCNTHSIVLMVIYLFSVMGFTVVCCEFSLYVHCCCLIAIVGLAATCSK